MSKKRDTHARNCILRTVKRGEKKQPEWDWYKITGTTWEVGISYAGHIRRSHTTLTALFLLGSCWPWESCTNWFFLHKGVSTTRREKSLFLSSASWAAQHAAERLWKVPAIKCHYSVALQLEITQLPGGREGGCACVFPPQNMAFFCIHKKPTNILLPIKLWYELHFERS